MQDEPLFLTTEEVLQRYRIKSKVTLWNWRKKLGFPAPVHHGRFFVTAQLREWDKTQMSGTNVTA
ncbi:hypothetical protein NFHSH190041_20360 [Shewanella sp. NFH-SH190041]|nr:hypothetical protein NFHSH190041_20360 [Shewanella sp. NFH-SH190041]